MLKFFKIFDFLLLLLGFIYGNLFAMNLSNLDWNVFFLFFIVFLCELLNKLIFSFFKMKPEKNYLAIKKNKKRKKTQTKNTLVILVNIIKRGVLLGLFLEAYKVGS